MWNVDHVVRILGAAVVGGVLSMGCGSNDGQAPEIGQISEAQVPVDGRPGITTELTFTLASGNVAFQTIVTNDTTVGTYRMGTEYWYTRTPSVETSLTLTSSAGRHTTTELDDFHADSSSAFTWKQTVGTTAWTTRKYVPTAGRIATLYKATDLDDARASIGMLLEQSTSDALTRIVWFKTTNTGTIFATTPASLSFEQVRDHCGKPSTDPRDIENTTWYHVASP